MQQFKVWVFGLMMLIPSLIALPLAAQSSKPPSSKPNQDPTPQEVPAQPLIVPVLMKPGELVFSDSFKKSTLRPQWTPLHQTRWNVANGMLHGIPATEEFQKSRT